MAYRPASGNYWTADNESYVETYGYVYDWKTAVKVCPPGWHLPSKLEWKQLTDNLGGVSAAGDKLKEAGTSHWKSPNAGATNETGFTALPGGYRLLDGFVYNGEMGFWWSATENQSATTHVIYWNLMHNTSTVMMLGGDKRVGLSVRCIKDE